MKKKLIIIAVLVTLFLEIFIFNYGFFRTLLFSKRDIKPKFEVQDTLIVIPDIDVKVTSINFEYEKPLTDKVTYMMSYFDEGSSRQIEINPKIILAEDKQYINLSTHIKCKSIMIDRLTETDLGIKSITLNHPNMKISIIRMMAVFLAICFIEKLIKGDFFERQYSKDSKAINGVFLINLSTVVIFILLYTICQFDPESFFIKPDEVERGDSIVLQAEAIMNGQIKLLEEPSDELKSMKNPYDDVTRDNEGVPYLYDVAYYDGSYYNYFGIAPVLTSILPFRIITGMYTHTWIFNMIYMIITVYALYGVYKKFVDRYIEKISLANFYLGFYAILFASNIFTLLRGMKYDIVITSGIAFLLISLNLALSIYKNPKFKILKLILLGITTALVVLSKPNLIVYYLLILFFVLCSMKELSTKEKIIDGIFICIPLGILAIFQMTLNYVRFDSIFEFGAQYQLSGLNVTTTMGVTLGKIYAVVMEYLFRFPTVNPLKFPFVFPNTDTSFTAINEVCYENKLIGLMAVPLFWAYFLKGVVKNDKELKWLINVILIVSILGMIAAGCTGGICEAYSIDFKLILSIGAVMVLLKWIESREDESRNKIFLGICMATILLMIPLSLSTENGFLSNFGSDTSVYFKNIFEFWS